MFNLMFGQHSFYYLSIAVKLLVIGFFPSSAKTKTIFISSWEENRST